MPTGKIMAAVICVGLAITGMLNEWRWLTLLSLVMWLGAMAYFGFGDRSKNTIDNEDILKEENE